VVRLGASKLRHPAGDGPRGPADTIGVGYYDLVTLHDLVASIFCSRGLSDEDASAAAETLVRADARGVWSHGVARVGMYCSRIDAGVANAKPNITVTHVSKAAALIDGDDGLGLVVAKRAAQEAISLVEETGIALVGVKRSGHFGMAAQYVETCVDAGLMAWMYTNSSPALPPWGGRSAIFGTSPFAFGAPTGVGQPPFLIDMAMSVVARGKLKFADQRGDPIPEGLALDSEGRPTTDGMEAFNGVVLPFGGVKGAAMSWMMDIVGGVFTGAEHAGRIANPFKGLDRPQNVGHLLFVAKPDLFQPIEDFFTAMQETTTAAKESPRAAGVETIYTPGEIEALKADEARQCGVALSTDVVTDLQTLAADAGISWPFATDGTRLVI